MRSPTKYEAERIEAMLRLGCVACARLGIPYIAECHHLLEGHRRLGHWFSLPLCPGHHRGVWTPEQKQCIKDDERVAISDGRKLFVKVYGTERFLWTLVQKRLKLPALWPVSKIVPRSAHAS